MNCGGRFRIVRAPMWPTSTCEPCRRTKCRRFRLRFVRQCAIQYAVEGDGAQSFRNRQYGRTAMPVREGGMPVREAIPNAGGRQLPLREFALRAHPTTPPGRSPRFRAAGGTSLRGSSSLPQQGKSRNRQTPHELGAERRRSSCGMANQYGFECRELSFFRKVGGVICHRVP